MVYLSIHHRTVKNNLMLFKSIYIRGRDTAHNLIVKTI